MNSFPEYLRIHSVDDSIQAPTFVVSNSNVVSKQLSQATGWKFEFVETSHSSQKRTTQDLENAPSEGCFEVTDMLVETPANQRIHRKVADQVARATNTLVQDLEAAQQTIRELQGELATHIPVIVKPQSDAASLLEQLLQTATSITGASQAALYMLDDATTALTMRAQIGLGRLETESRQLERSTADLEALVGYAVTIEDTSKQTVWKVPIECQSAICVPVSTLDSSLGTLWIFHDKPQLITDEQTSLIEMVAGRIASELQLHAMKRQIQHAKSVSSHEVQQKTLSRRQPTITPPLDHLEVSSLRPQTSDGESIVVDWSFNDAGEMILMSATIQGDAQCSASIAAAAQTAFCALRNRVNQAGELVSEIASVLSRLEPELVHGELSIAVVDCDHCTIETASISGALHMGDEDDFIVSAHQGLGKVGQTAWIGDGWKITRR